MPAESRSFSSEKSYSPSRLICCQDTTEPFAMAWDRISRAFAAPRRCPALLRRAKDAVGDIKGLTPHDSRVNETVSVATIPWRFTYLCWNIPIIWRPKPPLIAASLVQPLDSLLSELLSLLTGLRYFVRF